MSKRICIVVSRFPERSETFVVQHAVGLAQRGYDVVVLSQGVGPNIEKCELDGLDAMGVRRIRVATFGKNRIVNLFRLLYGTKCRFGLIAKFFRTAPWTRGELFFAMLCYLKIKELDPAFIHIHFANNAGAVCRFGFPAPVVVTWHGYDANMMTRVRGDGMYRELFKHPVQHTVNSTFMFERLVRLGAPSSAIAKVPMGIDLSYFHCSRNQVLDIGRLKVISVGRLDEVKGHTFLIQAVSELCSEGIPVSLAIIGDGPLRGQLEEQISSSDGGRAIALLGAKKREDVREALLDSDVFALAGVVSQSGAAETQGLVLIEAQAVGLPVVCTRVGGVPDSINDGETGILCEPGNITAIKKAIRFFAEHPDERFRYGKAGRHFVEGKFSVERMLDAFEKLYESFSGEEDGCRKIRGRIMSKLFLVPYKRKKQKGK